MSAKQINKENKQEAAELDNRYHALLEYSLQGILILKGTPPTITYANPAAEELFGYSKKELQALSDEEIYDLVHPEDRDMVKDILEKRLLKKTSPNRYESRIVRKDGSVRWVEVSSSLVDDDGEAAAQAAYVDITAKKETEKVLKDTEARFRAAVDGSFDSFYILKANRNAKGELKDLEIIDINSQAEKQLSSSKDKLIGKNISKVAAFPMTPDFIDKCSNVIKTGETLIEEYQVAENKLASGWYRHQIVSLDDGVAIINRNISARKLDEEKLQEAMDQLEQRVEERTADLKKSEEFLRTLIDSLPFESWSMDTRGRYTMQNSSSVDNWGKVIGRKVEDLPLSDELKNFWKKQNERALKGEIVRNEYRYRSEENAEEMVFESVIAPVKVEKKIVGIIGITIDITERKKIEESLRKSETELKLQSYHLREVNDALNILLEQREKDKNEFNENVLSNVKELINPYIENLKHSDLTDSQLTLVNILESNLNNITSPFIRKVSSKYFSFTPMEIRVANLVKEGKTNKDMAKLLGISLNTVLSHRFKIRSKLGLKNTKINLRTHLLSLDG